MRRILAALLLIPAVLIIQLSMMIDPEPGAEVLTETFKTITEKAGMKLVDDA